MKRLILIVVVLAAAGLLAGCRSYPIYQSRSDAKNIIADAYKNKSQVFIGFSDGTGGAYLVKSYIVDEESWSYSVDLVDPNRKSFPASSSKIKFAYPHIPGKKVMLYYAPYYSMNLECSIINFNNSILQLSSDDKNEVKLIDGSKIVGEIVGINIKTWELLVKTKVKVFTLPPEVVETVTTPEMRSPDVNVILIDGSQRKGTLLKDTADGVVIKTILGEETYPRYKVHKIMYQK